jgi:heterodisulfide reductase subunit A
MKTAVYLCNCGTNVRDRIDPGKVEEKVKGLPGVAYFRTVDFLCSEEGREFLEKDLREEKPGRVVIAACSPRDHESTFMRVLSGSGINPYLMQMANIREHAAWVTEDREAATEKTVAYIKGALARVELHEPLEEKSIDACTDALVVGAGPAGLKAALGIAEAGRKVVLVERSPTIGGLPVLYEEVSPGLECGPCMLEPLLNDVLHGDYSGNIELLTLSEVREVVGSYGNFIVKIRQAPRYVDARKCIGCGECFGPCPASGKDEANCGLNEKKAIGFTVMGALPSVPYIDAGTCLRFQGEDCRLCSEACPVGDAVDYGDGEKIHERNVGAVVLAVGSSLYDCGRLPNLGYGRAPDVYTSLEFERIMSSSGPTGGEIRTGAGEKPSSVAIVHCVGSLDKNHKEYCSGICCQYAFKFNHAIKGQLPGTRIHHFYRELVMPGKEEFALYEEARENPDAVFIRYRDISELRVSVEGDGKRIAYRDATGEKGSAEADMVVLCPAVAPGEGSDSLGALFDVESDRSGFFEELHGRTDSARSRIKGVYLAGACQSPMDVQKAMNQGMAAAGYVLSGLVPGRKIELKPIAASVDAERCSGCRVCAQVCPFRAISFDDEKEVAGVNAVLCQGCGTCVAACPAGAVRGGHFTDEEILAEIKGILG